MATSAGKLTTVVSTKGQVILPKTIRDRLRWRAGTKLMVEDTPDGVVLTVAPIFPPTTMEEVFGSLRHDGPPKSIEEMDAAVAAAFKRRARG
jgi:AbrB family looped-hinge helix DNA binding protein